MNLLRGLQYLLPSRRLAEERDMLEEMQALEAIAGRRALGNLTLAAENVRAVWGWSWLESWVRDMRYAFRVLLRQPSYTLVAIVSLALGIGANAAIFNLIDTIVWRDLPVRQPEQLVSLDVSSLSYYTFREFQAKSGAILSAVIATAGVGERTLDQGSGPQSGRVELVSGNYFDDLGVATVLGRGLTTDDDRRDQTEPAAVLSYGFWQRAYGGSRDVLGRMVRIQKAPFTIVGVANPDFFGVTVGDAPDLWVPLSQQGAVYPGRSWLDNRNDNFLSVLGRLKPGITARQAAVVLSPIGHQIDIVRAGPGLPDWVKKQMEAEQMTLEPAGKGVSTIRFRYSAPLRIVFVMVGIGLLLACVNVMGLQFARTDERRHELSVRLAIGAGRARVVRQLFAESIVVAMCGALLGLALCRPCAAGLTSLISQGGLPAGVRLDLRIHSNLVLFVIGISALAALICGIVPALRATRAPLAATLQQSARAVTDARIHRLFSRGAAAIQIGLSVVLVAGAFLFVFSLRNLNSFDTGLDRRNLLVADVDPREAGYKDSDILALNTRLMERLRGVQGVEAVSYSSNGLYSGRNSTTVVDTEFLPASEGRQNIAIFHNVGPQYCATIGAHLLAGRDFTERDDAAAVRVAIVTQEFARHFLPNVNPIGHNVNLNMGKGKVAVQVVGVVADIRNFIRRNPDRALYVPYAQTQGFMFTTRFLVRSRTGYPNVAQDLRTAIRGEDRALPVTVDSAETLLNLTLDRERLIAALALGFGILAITLAAVGVYGLLAYDVTRRTGEIGIRVALGATRLGVMRLVFREITLVVAAGIIAGTATALAMGGMVAKLVFGVTPGDPRVLVAAALALAAIAFVAAFFPARRAASMDPMSALRHE